LTVSQWFKTYGFADVSDDLLIGAYPQDAQDVAKLQRLGVNRILNLVEDGEYEPGAREAVVEALAHTEIEEERLRFADYGHLPPVVLDAAVEIIGGWLDEDRRVYVHCRAGWQRSAAVAAAVIAVRQGLDIERALAQVQVRKPSADPLPHQREDLDRWWQERQRRAA
jgi:predicted protein tyrosine phosphatase